MDDNETGGGCTGDPSPADNEWGHWEQVSARVMTLEEQIETMGDAFRGLWKSYYLDGDDVPNITRWTLTFIFKGHYVETPDHATPGEAMDWALKKLGK